MFLDANVDSVTNLLDLLTGAFVGSGSFVDVDANADVDANGVLTFSALCCVPSSSTFLEICTCSVISFSRLTLD